MTKKTKKRKSIFEHKSINQIYGEIIELYLYDKRPWVIGFSGGKDSTCVLQLIWYALAKISPKKRKKEVYVVSSDTLVEIPIVADHLLKMHKAIKEEAENQRLPLVPVLVRPKIKDTFWVNLLGRGYPAPSQTFRWCTERMKITPTSVFILDKVTQYGEVTIVLGARKAESATRAQVLKKGKEAGFAHEALPRHSTLPNAYIYTPIEDFSTDDVWTYLLQLVNPWRANNHDLLAMYRSANAGECPLVIDQSTPSCGNSRFGCWVCTLVKRDRAMEAIIDGGEEWLAPLLEFRDLLSKTQIPSVKSKYRDYRRRSGKLSYKKDGGLIRGPYYFEFRLELLKRLLTIQKQLPKDKNLQLITIPELHEIRKIWRIEEQDWEDSVPKIYREVYGDDLHWEHDDTVDLGVLERDILAEVAAEHSLPEALLRKLLDIERLHHGMSRRTKVFSNIDLVLSKEWRSEEVILAEINKGQGIYKL